MQLEKQMISRAIDASEGGFFFTPDDGEVLLARPKEGYDGAIPSGNSVAMHSLLRLGRFRADTSYDEKAAAISRAFAAQVQQTPTGFTHLLSALAGCRSDSKWDADHLYRESSCLFNPSTIREEENYRFDGKIGSLGASSLSSVSINVHLWLKCCRADGANHVAR